MSIRFRRHLCSFFIASLLTGGIEADLPPRPPLLHDRGVRGQPPSDQEPPLELPNPYFDSVTDAVHWEDVYDFDRAAGIYQTLLRHQPPPSVSIKAYLLYRLAFAQCECGDYSTAILSAKRACALDNRRHSYVRFYRGLCDRRAHPDGLTLTARYLAMRNTGSAPSLRNTTGLLHIFVRGRNTDHWTDFDITQAQFSVEQATEWIAGEAAARGITPAPAFAHRYVTLPENTLWRSTDVPEFRTSTERRRYWEAAILQNFNVCSFEELFNQNFPHTSFANRAIIFHTNKRGRAFASIFSHSRSLSDFETAYVHFPVDTVINPLQSVVYTHELMHLFGADDLYNKIDDPLAPDRELMKFGGYRLEKCSLSPITTYAIGWTNERPRTTRLRVVDSQRLVLKKETP